MKNMKGFTLIELMIVIAILGILLAIAIPAYQDYTIRAKVSECVNAAAPLKLGVSEFVVSNARFPSAIASVGNTFTTKFCNAQTYTTGALTLPVNGSVGATGITITLSAKTTQGTNVIWKCKSDSATAKYVPSTCR